MCISRRNGSIELKSALEKADSGNDPIDGIDTLLDMSFKQFADYFHAKGEQFYYNSYTMLLVFVNFF